MLRYRSRAPLPSSRTAEHVAASTLAEATPGRPGLKAKTSWFRSRFGIMGEEFRKTGVSSFLSCSDQPFSFLSSPTVCKYAASMRGSICISWNRSAHVHPNPPLYILSSFLQGDTEGNTTEIIEFPALLLDLRKGIVRSSIFLVGSSITVNKRYDFNHHSFNALPNLSIILLNTSRCWTNFNNMFNQRETENFHHSART